MVTKPIKIHNNKLVADSKFRTLLDTRREEKRWPRGENLKIELLVVRPTMLKREGGTMIGFDHSVSQDTTRGYFLWPLH